ncbi:hypothetical protein DID78_05650 [Candidatus Marinamargulisbacteria bacterium SCGC AG-343-D04]|nr:hypothetical protein DID78_05650 [Candidatus Marinamargulisbacteria bacterium SCGC AG-343-D04]
MLSSIAATELADVKQKIAEQFANKFLETPSILSLRKLKDSQIQIDPEDLYIIRKEIVGLHAVKCKLVIDLNFPQEEINKFAIKVLENLQIKDEKWKEHFLMFMGKEQKHTVRTPLKRESRSPLKANAGSPLKAKANTPRHSLETSIMNLFDQTFDSPEVVLSTTYTVERHSINTSFRYSHSAERDRKETLSPPTTPDSKHRKLSSLLATSSPFPTPSGSPNRSPNSSPIGSPNRHPIRSLNISPKTNGYSSKKSLFNISIPNTPQPPNKATTPVKAFEYTPSTFPYKSPVSPPGLRFDPELFEKKPPTAWNKPRRIRSTDTDSSAFNASMHIIKAPATDNSRFTLRDLRPSQGNTPVGNYLYSRPEIWNSQKLPKDEEAVLKQLYPPQDRKKHKKASSRKRPNKSSIRSEVGISNREPRYQKAPHQPKPVFVEVRELNNSKKPTKKRNGTTLKGDSLCLPAL